MIPTRSRVLPKISNDVPVVLTAWQSMLWAYRDQAVLAANQVRLADGQIRGSGKMLENMGQTGVVVSATINGALAAHEDAFAIDAFVRGYLSDETAVRGRDSHYVVITRATSAGQAIRPVRADLAKPEMVIAKNEKGAPIKLYDANRNLIGFKQEWRDGLTPDLWQSMQDAQAAFHNLFLCLLDAMSGKRFGSHHVQGRGLTVYEESLTTTPIAREVGATHPQCR
jgi:hypothetical protein